nr:hypothetical protein Iba_chr11bCG13240 [Ipomoea batatas]
MHEYKALEVEFWRLTIQEEMYWKQRSKHLCLLNGDQISRELSRKRCKNSYNSIPPHHRHRLRPAGRGDGDQLVAISTAGADHKIHLQLQIRQAIGALDETAKALQTLLDEGAASWKTRECRRRGKAPADLRLLFMSVDGRIDTGNHVYMVSQKKIPFKHMSKKFGMDHRASNA